MGDAVGWRRRGGDEGGDDGGGGRDAGFKLLMTASMVD